MKEFLLTGGFGQLKVGMKMTDAVSFLGKPERSGQGLRGWTIESYCGGAFQLSHYGGVVGLIGVYFDPKTSRSPLLPASISSEVPFTGSTTTEEFKAYLDANGIPWKMDTRLREATALKVGKRTFASFDENCLCSLLVSGE
jgi:hypothetical protein